MTIIDLKRIDGRLISWDTLAFHVPALLEMVAEDYGQAALEGVNEEVVKSLYEKLPTLTDQGLAQISQGVSPITYYALVASMLDPENRYGRSEFRVLKHFLFDRDVYPKITRRGRVSQRQEHSKVAANIAMDILFSAYAAASWIQRDLIICDGIYVPSRIPLIFSQILGVTPDAVGWSRRRNSVLLWIPPLEEVPKDLIKKARHLSLDHLVEQLMVWLRCDYQQEIDEHLILLVAHDLACELSSM